MIWNKLDVGKESAEWNYVVWIQYECSKNMFCGCRHKKFISCRHIVCFAMTIAVLNILTCEKWRGRENLNWSTDGILIYCCFDNYVEPKGIKLTWEKEDQ